MKSGDFLSFFLEFLTKPLTLGPLKFSFSFLELFVKILVPLVVFLVFYRFLQWVVLRLLTLTKFKDETKKKIRRNFRLVLKFLFLGMLFLAVANLLGRDVLTWLREFHALLNSPFFVSGNTKVSVVTLLMLVPVFYLASWGGKYVRGLLDSSLFDRLGLDEARRFSIGNLSRYFVMTIIFIFGLSIIGIDLSALGVLLGVLGVGIGFGLQSIVSNFIAGLIIISSRPIKEGDMVDVQGFSGVVQDIHFVSTVIRTFENEDIIIPNSFFVEQPVHNRSYNDRQVVIANPVGVSYDSNLEEVQEILMEINGRNPWRLEGASNKVRVLEFGDSSINLALRTLVEDIKFRMDAISWTNMEIWRAFKIHNIEIPFPQRVLHIQPQTPQSSGLEEEEGEEEPVSPETPVL